ncbi:MAG: ABC transporter permease [Bacteroidetes bacterium]|nr:ABC transporter permease [Bacteroidota bacterium]
MLRNYLVIAWRNIARNKLFATINVLGLAFGVVGCLVLYLITSYEFSFDRSYKDGDRVYRIVGERTMPSGGTQYLNSPDGGVAGFQTEIPGFAAVSGIFNYGGKIAIPRTGQPAKEMDNSIPNSYQSTAVFTWPEYFSVFEYRWLEGNARMLAQPNRVVLTESRARLYFGSGPLGAMVGKTVIYDDSLPVTVAGIVADPAGNTDLGYTDFLSISTATHSWLRERIPTEDWKSLSPHRSMAFVKLARGVRAEQVNASMAAYIKKNVHLFYADSKLRMWLQPLSDLHFTHEFHRGDDGDGWRKPYLPTLYAMIGVAIFILLIAAVNFVNLATAQAMSRAKEIGVRKVIGGRKLHIRTQMLVETGVLTLLAVVLAVLLVKPVLAFFRDYVPEGMPFRVWEPSTLLFLLGLVVGTTLVAGFYPAWVLSGYVPVLGLKGVVGQERSNMRRALIVFQFTVSLVFITASLVIGKQISYMQGSDKGFSMDRVLTVTDWNDPPSKLRVFVNTVGRLPGVEKAMLQGTPPMGFAQDMDLFSLRPGSKEVQQVSAKIGDEGFIPFYGMTLVAGRNMLHSDSLKELVINVTLTRLMGCSRPEDALGRVLYRQGDQGKGYPVVGVVADFHIASFHDAIPPVVIEHVPEREQNIAVRLKAEQRDTKAVQAVLAQMEAEWKREFPDREFRRDFLDASVTQLFGQERKTAWLVNMATGVTVFISCMGLFGLGLFLTRRRAKEISIRKVLGAGVGAITTSLSMDFVWLVGVSFVVATPLAWYFSHQWLQDFAYRTSLSWWVFVAAGMGALMIALVTVSFYVIRAAMANPIKYLRTE